MGLRVWLSLWAALSLTACGFQPLYSQNDAGISVHDYLRQIEVAPMEKRLGQAVFNSLVDELTPLGLPVAPTYRLTMKLKEQREGLGPGRGAVIDRDLVRLTPADSRLRPGSVGGEQDNLGRPLFRKGG